MAPAHDQGIHVPFPPMPVFNLVYASCKGSAPISSHPFLTYRINSATEDPPVLHGRSNLEELHRCFGVGSINCEGFNQTLHMTGLVDVMENMLALAIWIGNNDDSHRPSTKLIGSSQSVNKKLVNPSHTRRSERIKNYAKSQIYSGSSKTPQEGESIHDSNIDNCNHLFFGKAVNVVQICKGVGVSFQEPEDEVVSSIVRILRNEN